MVRVAAYVIVEVEITDPERYGQFVERVTETITANGGKFIVRGGAIEVVEGNWQPPRLALLAFPDLQRVHTWLQSPEFRQLESLRKNSSNVNIVVVEGS